MNLANFNTCLKEIANGRYCVAQISVTNHSTGARDVEFQCYIDGVGWTKENKDPNEVLNQLKIKVEQAPIPEIGDIE